MVSHLGAKLVTQKQRKLMPRCILKNFARSKQDIRNEEMPEPLPVISASTSDGDLTIRCENRTYHYQHVTPPVRAKVRFYLSKGWVGKAFNALNPYVIKN